MPMLGDVFLNTVYSESPSYSVKATDHPIESGENIVDHIERQPIIMNISGVCTGPDAAMRLNRLRKYREEGTVLTYMYRNLMTDMIIERFDPVHDGEVSKGFKFNITLKKIKVAKPSIIKTLKVPVRVQVQQVGNKGRQQKKTTKKKTPTILTAEEKALLKEMGNL